MLTVTQSPGPQFALAMPNATKHSDGSDFLTAFADTTDVQETAAAAPLSESVPDTASSLSDRAQDLIDAILNSPYVEEALEAIDKFLENNIPEDPAQALRDLIDLGREAIHPLIEHIQKLQEVSNDLQDVRAELDSLRDLDLKLALKPALAKLDEAIRDISIQIELLEQQIVDSAQLRKAENTQGAGAH